jgi:catechol-2,3-dioxygenase
VTTLPGFAHIGMVARDPAALAGFYRDVLGMTITSASDSAGPHGSTAFLSSRPGEEHHELAIFTEPRFRHLAFKVGSLADLRARYLRVVAQGIPVQRIMVHSMSIAFYFEDPEGNMIEIYWPVDLRNHHLDEDRLDLAAPEADLVAQVARLAGSGFTTRSPIPNGGDINA